MELGAMIIVALLAVAVGGALGWIFGRKGEADWTARAVATEGRETGLKTQLQQVSQEVEKLRAQSRQDSMSAAAAASGLKSAESKAAEANLGRVEVQRRLDAEASEHRTTRSKLAASEAMAAAHTQEIRGLRETLLSQKAWVGEQTTALQTLFSDTAARLLTEKGAVLNQQNLEQFSLLIKPFSEQMTEFRKRVDDVQSENSQARGRLEQHIETLAQSAAQVGSKAEALAAAMLGNAKAQGNWGEAQLIVLLEQGGFVNGKHFVTQYRATGDDGETLIPDTVINLPNDESLIVDSKVSLVAWHQYCSAETEEERKIAMLALVASLSTHYKDLAKKDYANVLGKTKSTAPFVMMFLPIEAAGIEAFRFAPNLFNDAQKARVVMVTPTTLFGMLQLVMGLWRIHDKTENADHIAEQGRLMLKKLGAFVGTFSDIGSRLRAAMDAFEKAEDQLHTGRRGTLLSIAKRMEYLGVEPAAGKEIRALIAELGEGEDDDTPALTGAEATDVGAAAGAGEEPPQI